MAAISPQQKLRLLFVCAALLLWNPVVWGQQMEPFEQALAAARAQQWERLEQLEGELADEAPVRADLDFHRILAKLPDTQPERVKDYARRYPHTPLADKLRRRALARYGETERWSAIRALADSPPRGSALQCYYHRAWLDQRPEATKQAGQDLWRSGYSRPDACPPLFEALASRGALSDDLIWQRLLLAFRAGNPGLMRYLADRLDSESVPHSELQRLYEQPALIIDRDPAPTLSTERRQALAAATVHRLAHRNPSAARALLESTRARALGLRDPSVRTELEQRIVWFMTIRGLDKNRAWRDQWLRDHGSADLLEQRARLAVRQRDWQGLPAWLARLDGEDKQSARWQYWLGRARHQQARPEAGNAALKRAAEQRRFYGFLAARRLNQPYAFNQRQPESVSTDAFADDPVLQRITWLRSAGEHERAVEEWRHNLYRSPRGQHPALAQLAAQRDWPELAIITALHSGARDVLDWRFPTAFADNFRNTARKFGLEPWLLMAVARRESGFQPAARSSAGARGLMQLMPATARRTARQLDVPAPTNRALLQADTSIRLGAAHLAELLQRYNGHRLKALAAYNAGAHHLERWLPEQALPFDVWIESISFHETRNYVQAVLAYRLILKSLHGDTTGGPTLALLSPGEKDRIQQPAASGDRRQLTRR